MGTWAFDIAGNDTSAAWGADDERKVPRYVAGISGDFPLLGSDWTWNAYYQRGESSNWVVAKKVLQRSRIVLAGDAVANPAVGGCKCCGGSAGLSIKADRSGKYLRP
jgi:hypothetical protein